MSEYNTAQIVKKLSIPDLFSLYSDIMEELRIKGVIRTSNNPVADYAEYLIATKLNLKLLPNSNKAADAEDLVTGIKYQIKSRRINKYSTSRQLGVIRNLDNAGFDYLVAVFFDDKFSVIDIYQIPKNIIKKYARFSAHQNGHILIMRGPILNDKMVKKLK